MGKERRERREEKRKLAKENCKSSECSCSSARLKSSENAPINKKI
jgi:hypothetical protein